MNKLFIISLIFLFSCGEMDSYNERAYNTLQEISTDSLIKESKRNLKRMLSKAKHEHSYADSVTTCLDSIQHELELRETELNQAQQRVMRVEPMTVSAYESEELMEIVESKMVYYESDSYEDWDGDGVYDDQQIVYIHDTIYIDSFATVKETITKLSLMTKKDKAKLKKEREKNKGKLPKFK